ncbi:hypothetical protein [Mesobacillus zeae]|uniref:Uncharacterized protein n=1 Tax=Mesobacillus zeae TaxID=1917180 RepID=A0A398BK36_9BACI|nr:hypothetical protein [Mesobacillus zeae]RID87753.1 hypothetical protein D1970_02600 [Mesobacillus zeae]
MAMEWFDRVIAELQDSLQSICDKYDQAGHMQVERSAKHPRIEFFVETDDNEREYFFTLFFDPNNEEFYMETYDFDFEQPSRTMLPDIEDIIDSVHEGFHDYLDMESDDTDLYEFDEADEDDEMAEFAGDSDALMEEVEVEWETPEVTAVMYEDEVEVSYQFGILTETGDGVLRRVNRIWTEDEELIKDESNFIFSKEEAGTIIAMIASHMDSLTEYSEFE